MIPSHPPLKKKKVHVWGQGGRGDTESITVTIDSVQLNRLKQQISKTVSLSRYLKRKINVPEKLM